MGLILFFKHWVLLQRLIEKERFILTPRNVGSHNFSLLFLFLIVFKAKGEKGRRGKEWRKKRRERWWEKEGIGKPSRKYRDELWQVELQCDLCDVFQSNLKFRLFFFFLKKKCKCLDSSYRTEPDSNCAHSLCIWPSAWWLKFLFLKWRLCFTKIDAVTTKIRSQIHRVRES